MQTSDKATPSHESNRVSRSQSGARFQLLSAKLIIFFKKNIYLVIFLHTFASHFHHNEKSATQAARSDSGFITFRHVTD